MSQLCIPITCAYTCVYIPTNLPTYLPSYIHSYIYTYICRNTGKDELTLKGHFGHVTALDCCNKIAGGVVDGMMVVSASYDQTLKVCVCVDIFMSIIYIYVILYTHKCVYICIRILL
jgi:hypothetical protein